MCMCVCVCVCVRCVGVMVIRPHGEAANKRGRHVSKPQKTMCVKTEVGGLASEAGEHRCPAFCLSAEVGPQAGRCESNPSDVC